MTPMSDDQMKTLIAVQEWLIRTAGLALRMANEGLADQAGVGIGCMTTLLKTLRKHDVLPHDQISIAENLIRDIFFYRDEEGGNTHPEEDVKPKE